jgi:hypothetical protein
VTFVCRLLPLALIVARIISQTFLAGKPSLTLNHNPE